jgi:hypothetical protein
MEEGLEPAPYLIRGEGEANWHCQANTENTTLVDKGGNMHQEKENREIVEKALDLLDLNQSITRRSFWGWAPGITWRAGESRRRNGKRSPVSSTGKWGIPSTTRTKMRVSAA